MFNSDGFSNETTFAISYELLSLLQWLAENEESALKELIQKALAQGMPKDIGKKDLESNDLYGSIIDFLELLEALMHESIHEQVALKAQEQKLQPDINKIDGAYCDGGTLNWSVENTVNKLAENPKANAQKMLYKELLRNWKPQNSSKN